MTKEERMKEIAKASPNFGKRVGYKMCVVDELYDIKELKKENADLRNNYENFKAIAEPEITILKEENAELKEKVKWYSEQVCYKECAEIWGNLTKAKEILKKYHDECPAKYSFEDIDDMAEQFLGELDK